MGISGMSDEKTTVPKFPLRAALYVPLATALFVGDTSAEQSRLNTLRQLFTSLQGCLAETKGPVASQLTLRFSLRRDGSLFGKPRVTYAQLKGNDETRRSFVESAFGALNACLPAPLTKGLGGAIAGRPIAVRVMETSAQTSAEVIAMLPSSMGAALLSASQPGSEQTPVAEGAGFAPPSPVENGAVYGSPELPIFRQPRRRRSMRGRLSGRNTGVSSPR
jgi:hypothetical protein